MFDSIGHVSPIQPNDDSSVSSAQVVRNLESLIDALSSEILRRVWNSPGYDEGYLDRGELSSYLTPNVEVILSSIRDRVEPSQDACRTAQEIGRARALQGVPLDSVVSSWINAERVILNRILRYVESLTGDDLRATVRWLGNTISQLTDHSVDAYRRTQDEVTAHYDYLATDLLASLTRENPPDSEEINRRAREIDVDPGRPYAAVAFATDSPGRPDGPEEQLRVRRYLLGQVGPHIQGRMLTGRTEKSQLILFPVPESGFNTLCDALDRATIDKRRPGSMLVSVSEQYESLVTAATAYFEARDALEVGRRLGWSNRLVYFRDVIAEVLLIRNSDIAKRLKKSLDPLAARPELFETCRTYLECGLSSSETARRLFVHANTVPYRLRLIEGILDRNLSNVSDMTDLIMSLRACQLAE